MHPSPFPLAGPLVAPPLTVSSHGEFTAEMFPVVAAGATLGTSTAREALEQLYASAHGAKWRASTRWLSGNVCRWHGIECDRSSHTTVVGIDLGDNRVSGTLPRHLAQLSEIKTLNIDASRLSGTLPAVLLSLAQMETLLLASNAALSGTVPHSLDAWASLRELDVAGTRLSGTLSPEVGALGHLQRLQLDHVFLSGTLPTELGWLGSARSMFTHSCKHLSGTLPTELGRASALQHVSFAATRLSGTIPSQIGELHQLRALWLVGTRLSGTLPRSIGGWHALRQLEIHGNRLSGTLPTGMSGLRLSRCVLTNSQGQHASAHHGAFSFPHRCVLTNSQGPLQPLHSLRPVDRARDDTNLFACPLPEVLPAPCRPFLVCHGVGGNRTRGLSTMAMQGRRRGGGRGGNKRRRGPPRVVLGVAT